MGSLFSEENRKELKERIKTLKVDDPTHFGTLTAAKAVCHLTDSLLAPMNKNFEDSFKPSFYSTKLGQWFIISSPIPWPKGKIKLSKKIDEILFKTETSKNFDQDKKKLIEAIELFGTKENEKLSIHPILGNLSNKQWATLGHRHVKYHLTQFGR